MRYLVFFLLFFPLAASAHPADRLCLSGEKAIENQCVVASPALGLNDPNFYALVREYWHCRRGFISEDTTAYAGCVQSVVDLKALLGDATPILIRDDIIHYYDIIPAFPLVRAPGDFLQAKAECAACMLGRQDAQAALFACQNYKTVLMNRVACKLARKRRCG